MMVHISHYLMKPKQLKAVHRLIEEFTILELIAVMATLITMAEHQSDGKIKTERLMKMLEDALKTNKKVINKLFK